MNCGGCSYWGMGIPVGHCGHPDGYFQPTSDRMVFDTVTEKECPKQRNMLHLMNNVMRVDYVTLIGNQKFNHTVLFNKKVISECEVENLIETGMVENDNRVIVITPEQFDLVLKPKKES
ncbi:MAG: hypothetical protein GX285_07965 [Clostridiales bacterium]|nr:hypothetical protein [Clostridiales bacterium]